MKRLIVPGVVASLLGACSLAPKYVPPTLDQPVTVFKEAGDWAPAAPADDHPRADWWQVFGDAHLSELEEKLRTSNPDLAASFARFQQARAVVGEARSREFPTVSADASATRGRLSQYSDNLGAGHTGNDFTADLSVAWEIDLFGRLRNMTAEAKANAQASAADLAALELSLQGEIATNYFALRGDDATVRLLEDSVKQYDTAWEQTKRKYDGGAAAATDVDQADLLRQNALAQLAGFRLDRATREHAIAVLVGLPPANFTLPAAELAGTVPVIPVELPSSLLERRPDVASAERRVAAANANIGVARAAWFPVFSLQSAFYGFQSYATGSWITAPAKYWAVGPVGSLPLFDAGGRAAQNRQARAQYDEYVADFRKTALTAYQEVEDSLVSVRRLTEQQAADAAAAKSALSAAYHADQRYSEGVADFIEVTTTHTAALSAQSASLTAQAARLNATVTLVQALGGGWVTDPDHLNKPTL